MDAHLFRFFISGEDSQIFPDHHLWGYPLSGKKVEIPRDIPSGEPGEGSIVTIGDYFSAACQFLSENDFSCLRTGLDTILSRPVPMDQIEKIIINLVKHGAFYHPLKIHVILKNRQSCFFVLNGAVSKAGLSLVKTEYQLIKNISETRSKNYLPRVFGRDLIQTDKGKIGFFLGEWFKDYREFHATDDQGKRQVVIWASDGGCHYISQSDALPIYHEIARILTYHYNIETFKQISPWHHAAGDFIVRLQDGSMDVRLITVRGFAPLMAFTDSGADKKEHILPALLFFFLNLTIRMRLDRLNGTGSSILLGEEILPAIVHGFLQALDEKSMTYDYGDLRLVFIEFFQNFDIDQISGVMEKILESCHPDPSEMSVIEKDFDSHCKCLYSIFKNL